MRRRTRRKPNLGSEMRRIRRKPIRESIPSDVIVEILARLPVKDLLRLRCVSKFFKSLIDSPDFIKLHLSHSRKTKTDLYGIYEVFKIKNLMLFDLSKSINKVAAAEMVDPPSGFYRASYVQVKGSCDGLIALKSTRCDGDITFWNPLTGKFKRAAKSIPRESCFSYGFGYDPNTDDYKLLKIIVSCTCSDIDSYENVRMTIYSLRSNSWKEIGNNWSVSSKNYIGKIVRQLHNGPSVLANNSLHWLINDEGVKIAAFDLVNEEFQFHDVPDLGFAEGFFTGKLSVLDGCLTLISNDQYNVHVWVMKEYQVKESWTKLLYFNRVSDSGYWLRGGPVVPLAYSRDGAKLLLNHSCNLFWYDLSTQKVKPCLYGNGVSRGDVIPFVGSLVALNLSEKPSSDGKPEKRCTRGDTLKRQLSSR